MILDLVVEIAGVLLGVVRTQGRKTVQLKVGKLSQTTRSVNNLQRYKRYIKPEEGINIFSFDSA